MKKIFLVLLMTCIMLISVRSCGYAFRCGEEIAGRWDQAADVQGKCGQPFRREFVNERINGRLESVEKWFYNCGASDFIYSLTILNSVVVAVDPVSRGRGESDCKKK
jgi:hypothetical protein